MGTDLFDIISNPELLEKMRMSAEQTIDIDACIVQNETGDAKLLSQIYAGEYLYNQNDGLWYKFIHPYWVEDSTNTIKFALADVIAGMYLARAAEYKAQGNHDTASKFVSRSNSLRTRKRTSAERFRCD